MTWILRIYATRPALRFADHYRKADRISSASLGINQRLTAVHAIAQNNARDVVTLIQCSEGLSPMAVRLEALGAAFAVKS